MLIWKQNIIFVEDSNEHGKRSIPFNIDAEYFIANLPEAAAEKVRYNIHRVMLGERNNELFKKLENTDIWEFRTLYNRTAYRLFAFWDNDQDTLVIVTHGIVKKTKKTPNKEIAKAEAIRKYYFENKKY